MSGKPAGEGVSGRLLEEGADLEREGKEPDGDSLSDEQQEPK